jgi:hypothetical protein
MADERELIFAEEFDGNELDLTVWVPHYLPAWSSRARTHATYTVARSELRLWIPPTQDLWVGEDHVPPIRVSGIQSGTFSGPVGSTAGQPYRDGPTVREEQPTMWGWTADHGRLEMRARGMVGPRSMFAWWLDGLEDVPEHSGEICVFEIFGDALEPGSAAVGMGLKKFRDPAIVHDFDTPRLAIDPADFHAYAVDWNSDRADFL